MVDQNTDQTGFQGKHETEEFQFYFRQHWIRLFKPFIRMLFYNAIIGVISYFTLVQTVWDVPFARRLTFLALTAALMVANLEFLMAFYRYFLYVIVVTDRKIHRIKKTLMTIDDHQSVDLWSLQEINKSQHGVVQNMLGYGSISLEAQETVLRLHFIPNIADKYVRLMALQEWARGSKSASLRFAKQAKINEAQEARLERIEKGP